LVGACDPNKDEQCKTLVGAVEKADALRVSPKSSPGLGDAYFDGMVQAKLDLAKLPVSDEELVTLRDKEWKAFEDFIHAQREILDSKVPSELADAEEKRARAVKAHDEAAAALGAYCGVKVRLASRDPAP
jgi:hypothetical protein